MNIAEIAHSLEIGFSLVNPAIGLVLAFFGHCITGCSYAFFHYARIHEGKKYFIIASATLVLGAVLSGLSMIACSMSIFSILRVLKIPAANLVLYCMNGVHYNVIQFLLLFSIVGLAVVTVLVGDVTKYPVGDRMWMRLLENNIGTQVFIVINFAVGIGGFAYTLLQTRPERLRAVSLYNLAFPISGICVHGFFDIFAKIGMEEVATHHVEVWVWIVLALGCVLGIVFSIWYVDFMYGQLHIESMIPLHTVGLIIAPIIGGYFILGEELIHPVQFYICLGLITLNLAIFFYLSPTRDPHSLAVNSATVLNPMQGAGSDGAIVAKDEPKHAVPADDIQANEIQPSTKKD